MKDRNVLFASILLFFMIIVLSACAGKPSETLEHIAESTRKTLPTVIDEYTTMTNCEALPNRTMKFTYNVKGSYTEEQKYMMTQGMKPVLMKRLKERKEIEFYLVNNVRFEHLFLDSTNNVVVHVEIEAMDYK